MKTYENVHWWIVAAKDVLLALGAITAIVVGIAGLYTWKRQVRATTDLDLSRRMIASLYELQRATTIVREARDPASPENRPPIPDLDEALNNLTAKRLAFKALAVEASALWGSTWNKATLAMDEFHERLIHAIWHIADLEKGTPSYLPDVSPARQEEFNSAARELARKGPGSDKHEAAFQVLVDNLIDSIRVHMPSR